MGCCFDLHHPKEEELVSVTDIQKILVLQKMIRGFLVRDKIRLRSRRRKVDIPD
ncbi:MAG: hypothetical protein MJ252_30285 [archaeon]|nr:hypothetical protein [archaeon]